MYDDESKVASVVFERPYYISSYYCHIILDIKQAHLLAGELEVNKTKSLNAVTRHTDTRYKALHVRLKLTCIITSYTHTHRATA